MTIGLNRTTLLTGSTILAALSVWFFLIGPTRAGFEETRSTISNERVRKEALEKRVVNPVDQEQQLKDTTERLAKLQELAFDDQNALETFTRFEQIADQEGVTMEFSLNISSTSSDIGIVFDVEGTFEQIMRFVEALERLPLLIIVDDLGITKSSDAAYRSTITTRVFPIQTDSQTP